MAYEALLAELKAQMADRRQPVERPKRNDPCYCGSGRKYKSCHMSQDREADKELREWEAAGRFLRRDILKFARDERFSQAVAESIAHYWNGLYTVENAEEMSLAESMRYFDWLAFDYDLDTENGAARLIEVYRQEKDDDLSSHQKEVLDQWIAAPPAIGYELIDHDGQTLYLRALVSDELVAVYEPGGPGGTEPGDILISRVVPVRDRLQFSTNVAYIPKAEVLDLPDKLEAAREAFEAEHPGAELAEFMRAQAHVPIHHALAQAEAQGRPPVERLNPERGDTAARKTARGLRRLQR